VADVPAENAEPRALPGRDPVTGAFQVGNRLWEARSSAGPKPLFATPEALWAACTEYFQWVQDNPLYEDKVFAFQGAITHATVTKMRAMTLTELYVFLDIDRKTWALWRDSRADLLPVVTRVEDIIYAQKFSGAAADLLNANIIARDLGLREKLEATGKDGKDLIPEKRDDLELARFFAGILTNAAEKQESQK